MPEHYTKNTEETLVWCDKCFRLTVHRVDDRRRGPCLEHSAPIEPVVPVEDKQADLFGEK